MLVYIHIPYCRGKCRYCAFSSQPLGRQGAANPHGPLAAYTSTLVAEIALWRQALGPVPVSSIFFGGGTPSLLAPQQVGSILEALHAAFRVASGAEISIEANPESALQPGWLAGVAAAGVNRLSFGVQSFHAEELRLLGRIHTAQQAIQAVEAAQRLPFNSISLDLMWGLPCAEEACPPVAASAGSPSATRAATALVRQAVSRWQTTLATAIALGPQHLSCYGLMLEEGTPLARQAEGNTLALPPDRTLTAQYLHTVHALRRAGFAQYEIANFAKPGHQCQHNLGYWHGEEYMGLGPAAVATVGSVRRTNPADVAAWHKAVVQCSPGKLPQGEEEHLTPATLEQELLMLALRTTQGLPLGPWAQRTGRAFTRQFSTLVDSLQRSGLATRTATHFALTPRGLLLSNAIIEQFFAALPAHSG
ncbi:coproporphyrinogen-III oxidase family protein [Desulfovibrio cuneatus]|uniref:coproporphyrinogen-III oxidase family protein n=1 Tax=Desulfovibrio cuneatus TaxID=159728 RepID=UPI0004041824|nr:coproporphyrinogen-III oxidase family protein [Desulfovibrio cuneatus]